ncbi:collagenase [Desulfomarina profundi]|uniref:Collagenase n=1 Tax=Desulfomarina profundi TaxID=2772557 RepID=A0A8D5FKH5_9BACT|nr:U32 family peptidase [Desulfomarina profundi]BCL62560.1 collagenase [Desulfomarina profundi]
MKPEPVTKLELLAPAGNLQSGIAAIDHGADAVYIGGPEFGARRGAGNSPDDIEKLVAHAHQFYARVYVALNTLLNDRELERAVVLAHRFYDMGVDALIIQDTGLLEADLPPIPLHASTQMNNRTVEKVVFLEKVGFRQVVLARELSLGQIRKIREKTTVPLEFFVHGALCVSYSGQCYISEVMTGRSANRGECAQFCRHRFTLTDLEGRVLARDRYLLSLKDLDLSLRLEELVDAGVTSFKIEGRLKDENYVKNVTAFYRQKLDDILEKKAGFSRSSTGSCEFSFVPDTSKSFNRGQTSYFLDGGKKRPGSINSPKSRGSYVGSVSHIVGAGFVLKDGAAIHNGDGLCYFSSTGVLKGIKVNRVSGERIYPHLGIPSDLARGMKIYRNADQVFARELGRSSGCRKIAVDLFLSEINRGLSLAIVDEDGVQSLTENCLEKESARSPSAVHTIAEKQLRKSGETVFKVKKVVVKLDSSIHLPVSALNRLRRDGLAAHLIVRLEQYRQEKSKIVSNSFPWIKKNKINYLDNITNRKAQEFYHRHGAEKAVFPSYFQPDRGAVLMKTKYCIRAQLGICSGKHEKEPLILTDNIGEYQVFFDCENCEMVVKLRHN